MEIEKTEMSAEIRISEPQQMQMFLMKRTGCLSPWLTRLLLQERTLCSAKKVLTTLPNTACQKPDHGCQKSKESDMFKLAKATGARVANNIDELTASDLGSADLAEERRSRN